jgi:plasmid stabilization system protein ParE
MTEDAAEQIRAARDWWMQNREKAPFAFDEDLNELFDRLEDVPELVGRPMGQERHVRRAYLPRIRYYVSFQFRQDEDQVIILTIWHGNRQPPP